MITRRSLLQALSLFPLSALSGSEPLVLEVFFVAKSRSDLNKFLKNQSKWVDSEELKLISNDMKSMGQIISFDAKTEENKRVLKICFRSHFDYQVFRMRMKKKVKREYLNSAGVQLQKFFNGKVIQG